MRVNRLLLTAWLFHIAGVARVEGVMGKRLRSAGLHLAELKFTGWPCFKTPPVTGQSNNDGWSSSFGNIWNNASGKPAVHISLSNPQLQTPRLTSSSLPNAITPLEKPKSGHHLANLNDHPSLSNEHQTNDFQLDAPILQGISIVPELTVNSSPEKDNQESIDHLAGDVKHVQNEKEVQQKDEADTVNSQHHPKT
uniref:Uncharacterized protein n=1 Tax=Ditylenchus dipsaci TaxID=166011 RepID=A0A915E3H6_9BILA